tara:strand:- start:1008 stop:1571 length:564 start_codon:yes stop_codon:yes gene_type:complete
MTHILKYCNKLSELSVESTDEILKDLKTINFQKGDYLLKEGQICKHLFFVEKGLVKIYFVKEDKEFIMRFIEEGKMFSVFESFLTQIPSNYSVVALEQTTVSLINYNQMEVLCEKHHCVETFYRKLISLATINMTRRISEILEKDLPRSYNHFLIENKQIIQRISLGDMAKYLGITQQSLSRIRKQK